MKRRLDIGTAAIVILGVIAIAAAGAGPGEGAIHWLTSRKPPKDPVTWSGLVVLAGALVGAGSAAVSKIRERTTPSIDAVNRAAAILARSIKTIEVAQWRALLDSAKRINVGFDLLPFENQQAENAGTDGSFQSIYDYFNVLKPQRLLITGDAGSGKTTLTMQLINDMFEKGGDTPKLVPIRLSLADWNPDVVFDDWLVEQLHTRYEVASLPIAKNLVSLGMILPVLDGLDEMDGEDVRPDDAARALAYLNEPAYGVVHRPLVITCRRSRYDELLRQNRSERNRRLLDCAVIQLRNISSDQVVAYIEARASKERWKDVIRDLAPKGDHALADQLSTPWKAALAVSTYEDEDGSGVVRDPSRLLTVARSGELSEHLLSLYVPSRAQNFAKTPGKKSFYDAKAVEGWRAYLARYLESNKSREYNVGGRRISEVDIITYLLWPIAGTSRVRRVDAGLSAVVSAPALIWAAIFSSQRGPIWFVAFLVVLIVYLGALCRTAFNYWPVPQRFQIRQLKNPRSFAPQLLFGLLVGGLVWSIRGSLAGIVAGLGAWLAGGLSTGIMLGLADSTLATARSPKAPLRSDRQLGLAAGLTGGLVMGVLFGLDVGMVIGVLGGILYGAIAGMTVASAAWRRYLALLLCTRGRLPIRLETFADWAYRCGIFRVSGVAYQFRHPELQSWLARKDDPGRRSR